MGSGLRIGRIFGIQLTIDWSWVFIFVLLTWNLVAVFSQWHPQWSPMLSFYVAFIASLLFFASILLHELAHALVAIAHGLRVSSITLFLFGGVSNIEREPPSPRVEFLTAIAGPLVSIGLGVGFTVLASLLTGENVREATSTPELMMRLGPLPTLLAWLGPVNVLIGLFNLVPGFPLDGGRVLRSVIWRVTGNLRQATRWVTGLGQAIGWALILTGIAMSFGMHVPIFGTGLVGGLWLAFIGWFLNGAATQSYARVVIEDELSGVTVARLMRTSVTVVPADMPVDTVVNQYFMQSDEHAFPVMDGEKLVGLVCLADLRKLAQDMWSTARVRDLMTPVENLVTASPDEPASEAMVKLVSRDVSQLPVLQAERFVGLLRRRDIARWLELRSHPDPGVRHSFPRFAR